MLRRIIASLAILVALPAAALDIEDMTPEERDIFRSEIRDYLLENPEVLMEAIAVLEQRRAEEAALAEVQMLEDNRKAIFDDGFSYVGGNPDGDVTIVEFLDYRCSFCKRAHPNVKELVASDDGVRLIIKEFPILGPESELASRYALATKLVAGDDAYLEVHDRLMDWAGPINEGALGRIGRGIETDHAAVLAKMDSAEVDDIISANRALAQRLQINGTPSFVMGDAFVRGFVELPQMRAIVEEIRADQG